MCVCVRECVCVWCVYASVDHLYTHFRGRGRQRCNGSQSRAPDKVPCLAPLTLVAKFSVWHGTTPLTTTMTTMVFPLAVLMMEPWEENWLSFSLARSLAPAADEGHQEDANDASRYEWGEVSEQRKWKERKRVREKDWVGAEFTLHPVTLMNGHKSNWLDYSTTGYEANSCN